MRRIPVGRADALAITFLTAVVFAAFGPAWAVGGLFFELDTLKQNAPFMEYAAASIRGGELPLWNPYLAAGFPQFAEGQTGVFHPVNLPFLALGAAEPLLVWGPPIRSLLAALAAFALARALRLSPTGSALAGLVYGLGSFAVAQQHHLNIAGAAPALPAMLAAWEMAFRTTAPLRRVTWFALAATAFAVALVAVHPQTALITGLGVAAYVVASLLVGRWRERRSWRGRAAALAWSVGGGGLIVVVAAGLAAVQILPLAELIQRSGRGAALAASEASRFAVPPLGAVQLAFPAIFGDADGYWFSWNRWETAFYAGLTPLAFALLAILRPTRLVVVLASLALLAVLIAGGAQSPVPLAELVHGIPGLDRARAPGRFTIVAVLMLGMLAAAGLDAFVRRPSARRVAVVAGLIVAAFAALVGLRAWAGSGLDARDAIAAWLGTQPELAGIALSTDREDLVLESLNPARLSNLAPVVLSLAALSAAVLAARRPSRVALLAPVVAGLAAMELGLFAATFHPVAPVEDVLSPPPLARAGTPLQPFPRTYISEAVDSGSNRLLPARIAEATAYTPLIPSRTAAVLEAWELNPPRVARVIGAAAAVYLSDDERGFESYGVEGLSVTYSVNRPSLVIDEWSPAAEGFFELPSVPNARELHLVLSMDGAAPAPEGEPIASLEWLDGAAVVDTHPLRAGRELSERTAFGPLRHREPAHSLGEVAATVGKPIDSVYTLGRIPVPTAASPRAARIRVLREGARVRVHGLSLIDELGGVHRFWAPQLELVPGDEPVLIGRFDPGARFELRSRVQLVDSPDEALERMLVDHSQYPPRVVVEAGPFGPSLDPAMFGDLPAGDTIAGSVRLVAESPHALSLAVRADEPAMLVIRDAYDPSWKAAVDGRTVPVFPIDVAMRGLAVPPGDHRVELWFDSAPFRIGSIISLASVALVAVFFVGLAVRARRPADVGPPTTADSTGPSISQGPLPE